MVQRIKVQSGQLIYEASNPAYDMNMDVMGRVSVTKELQVGNDPLADGIIYTEANTDLILSPGINGDISLQPTGTGDIVLKNAVWPQTTPVPGMYLGASSANVLEYQYSVMPSVLGSDTLTSSQLNLLYPYPPGPGDTAVYPGQQVLGPNVVYQRVSGTLWRTMAGLPYVPVNKAGDTMTGPLILSGAPSTGLQAATKQYVDDVASGLNAHASCETGTTAALPACTYNNGVSGVGATLTANVNGAIGTVGGYASLAINSRVLVKNQASQIQNGIYVVTQLGSAGTPWILTRASDFDGSPTSEVAAGDFMYVQEGTLGGTQWVQTNVGTGTSPDHIIVGTDNIVFTQLAGSGTYTGGSGINVASNVISNTGVLSNVAGTGIGVSGATGNVTISNTGVLSNTAGSGISVSSSTGNITISNTGVTSLIAGTNVSLSGATGNVTISVSGIVGTATNLSGGLANQVPFQSAPSTTTFSAGLTYNDGTGTLSVGTASTGVIAAQTGQALELQSDTTITLKTNGTSRLAIGSAGDFTINGSAGSAGQVLASNGAGTSPSWQNSSITINGTTISLGGSGTVTAAAGTLTGTTLNASVVNSSLTSVGTLTSLSVSGNETVSGNLIRSVQTGISAAGATLATATDLTKDFNVVSTVAAGTGVSLMPTTGGMSIIVVNTGANALNVYPDSASAQIDSLGVGTAFSLPVGARIMFFSVSSTQWYTLNATYS